MEPQMQVRILCCVIVTCDCFFCLFVCLFCFFNGDYQLYICDLTSQMLTYVLCHRTPL